MNGKWRGWWLTCMVWILAIGGMGPVYSREAEPLSELPQAWQEDDGVRLQWELTREFDRLEVTAASGSEGKQVTYGREDRISVHLAGGNHEDGWWVQLRGYEGKTLQQYALFQVRSEGEFADGGLRLRKTRWERSPEAGEGIRITRIGDAVVSSVGDIRRGEDEMLDDLYGTADAKRLAEETIERKRRPTESRASASYEVEPNHTIKKADWSFAGKDAYGRIQSKGDVDYWKVKAPAAGTFTMWLSEIPDGRNYDLAVYDEEGGKLGESRRGGNMDEAITDIGREKGNWLYISVQGQGHDMDKRNYYRLRSTFFPSGQAMPDSFEHNDSFDDAADLMTGSGQQATIHREGDVDFYKFQVPLASTIRVNLSSIPKGLDLDLYLYDKDRKQMAASNRRRETSESVVYNGDPGTYYLKVSPKRGATLAVDGYQLLAEVKPIPVILIPGIGGSRLVAEERGKTSEVWVDVVGMTVDGAAGVHRRVLPLRPSRFGGTEMVQKNKGIRIFPEQTDHGFRAIEYLAYDPNFEFIEHLSEQYHSMVVHLERLGYRKNETLFAFPYDWRLSNTENAKLFKNKMQDVLSRSEAAQVQLVAHSMGGILLRETLLKYPSEQKKVKRVIYMGTPFIGSPRAYQAIKMGYNFNIPPLSKETGKEIAEYSPAVYELLPSKAYTKKQSFLNLVARSQRRPFTYDEIRSDNRIRLDYTPLVEFAEKQHNRWDDAKIRVPQYLIVGDGQMTLHGYDYDQLRGILIPFFGAQGGDGTVPLVSAEHVKGEMKRTYYIHENHGGLPKNPFVIQQVSHLLLGMEGVQKGMRSKREPLRQQSYFVVYRKDGKVPAFTIRHRNQVIGNSSSEHDISDLFTVEYHGHVLIVYENNPRSSMNIDQTSIQSQSSNDEELEIIQVLIESPRDPSRTGLKEPNAAR